MKSRQVILELQSNRLDVVLYEGDRQTQSARIKIELDSDPITWVEGVEKLQKVLSKTVENLGLKGLPTIVYYSNSTQVVELVSTEVKTISDACEVARLRCIDSLPFSSLSSVCDANFVGKDTGRDLNMVHVLGAADREDALEAMALLVEQSGLRFEYASPISASIFRLLFDQRRRKSEKCEGRLYLGERHSYFLITDHGRLVFSRLINIGLDAMARSLTRPIRTEASSTEIELDFDEARQILLECGIPNKQIMVDETRGLSSREIIPLMQPVLQRLLVELRQSLRFGLTEHQRSSVQIEISGPGCALSGIEEYLGQELELTIEADLSYQGFAAGKPAAPESAGRA
ncbi:MAG: hypothetical protein O7G85_09070, partial [Planctomycetota bacterium]|nr:hypothetical protein [Planctomycetota bacterium]